MWEMMTARRFEVEVALAGLRSGPCGWGTRLRQLDGHRKGLLGPDVHCSSPTVNTSAGPATASGFKIIRRVFDERITTDIVYEFV